jgi:hypothetical protein
LQKARQSRRYPKGLLEKLLITNDVLSLLSLTDWILSQPAPFFSDGQPHSIDCKEYREAERLIATALAGHPPEE